jgi:nicotinamidase-related amidase
MSGYLPSYYDSNKVGQIFRVDYQAVEAEAIAHSEKNCDSAAKDKVKIALLIIDAQNTFCIPGHELFVGGRSGTGAVDDNDRLCKFIYNNAEIITKICPTLDTHTAFQIFHTFFWVNSKGEHPIPNVTEICSDDIKSGAWMVNPKVACIANGSYVALQNYAIHYAEQLEKNGRYTLRTWGYHAMLGGIGHALVPCVEEAIFFHTIARASNAEFEIKGGNPLTENYSVFRPEVIEDQTGRPIAQNNARFVDKLIKYDYIIAAGQAASHCFAWSIRDLMGELGNRDKNLIKKVYIMEDCTSPVVIPGVVDYTDNVTSEFEDFKSKGINIVKSTEDIADWPGIKLA